MILSCDQCDKSLCVVYEAQVIAAISEEDFVALCPKCYEVLLDKQEIADVEDV